MANRWYRSESVKSIPEMLFNSVRKHRTKPALIYYGREISYRELYTCSSAASVFIGKSVSQDGKVAILMPNIPQFAICYYGALMAERIVVPVNFISIANDIKTKKANEIKFTDDIVQQISDARPETICVVDFLYPALMKMDIGWPCKVVVAGVADYLPTHLKILYPIKALRDGKFVFKFQPDAVFLKDILKNSYWRLPISVDMFRLAQFQYTGGTTGVPKPAALTHSNLVSNVLQSREALGDLIKDGEEIVLGALPFFHIYGLTVVLNTTLLCLGGTVVLMPAFDPRLAVKNISKYKVTLFPGVNRMYQAITDLKPLPKKSDLESLKISVSGAGPIDQKVVDSFLKLTRAMFVEGYGLSETSPVISIALLQDLATKKKQGANLLGRPVEGTKIKIIDGEICVSGPQVMELKNNLNRAGDFAIFFEGEVGTWFKTGDMGYIENGCLYMTDRKKDMIKVMGENIYASKIENEILNSFVARESYVVGVPDQKRGETAVACVVPKLMTDGNCEEKIIEYLKSKFGFSPFYVPSRILLFDSFDNFKNPLGKVLKRKLKEEVLKRLGITA